MLINSSTLLSLSLLSSFFSFIAFLPQENLNLVDSKFDLLPEPIVNISNPNILCSPYDSHSLLVLNI